jgi:hypothetical protein
MTPEAVKANWEKICDFSDASKPQSVQGESPMLCSPGQGARGSKHSLPIHELVFCLDSGDIDT